MGYNKLTFIAISSLIAFSYAQTQRDNAIAKVLKMSGIKLSDYQLNNKTVVKVNLFIVDVWSFAFVFDILQFIEYYLLNF